MLEWFWMTCLAGLRGRSVRGVFVLGVLLMGVAFLAASFSPRQPQVVAIDVGFSGLRLALVLMALFWVQELLSLEIDRRTVILALAYPRPRAAWLVGRYAGILALLALAALLLGLLLWLVGLQAGLGYEQTASLGLPFWATLFGVWVDVAVVTAFGVLIASLSTVPVLPLALGGAFAIAAKALGEARAYILSGADGQADLVARFAPLLDTIHWLLPDLSRLDWRTWALYGTAPEGAAAGWSLVMAAGYAGVLLVLAVHLFGRREFT